MTSVTFVAGWYTAPDGRRFRVFQAKCLHSDCWQARCECGHKLTAHDFDADGAHACALDALTRVDPMNRRDFAHPRFQCKASAWRVCTEGAMTHVNQRDFNQLDSGEREALKLARSMDDAKLARELRLAFEAATDWPMASDLRRLAALCIVKARRMEAGS